MSHGSASQQTTFGYLSTVETDEYGYFGGYLVVSELGRPLEFHCTTPVQPSRAQRILYGATLESYLLGEQICGALLNAAKLTPVVTLTDSEVLLQMRTRFSIPIAFIRPKPEDACALKAVVEPSEGQGAGCGKMCGRCPKKFREPGEFNIGAYRVQLASGFDEKEEQLVGQSLARFGNAVDLMEPFARIQEAIREAQRIGGRGTEAHDQAA
jgi:hypothetical protein